MQREVRMVPGKWEHPKDSQGKFIPLFSAEEKAERIKEWELEDGSEATRPTADDFMPDWHPNETTHFMMYETTSEGTPASPALESPERLAEWLSHHKIKGWAGRPVQPETWLALAESAKVKRDAKLSALELVDLLTKIGKLDDAALTAVTKEAAMIFATCKPGSEGLLEFMMHNAMPTRGEMNFTVSEFLQMPPEQQMNHVENVCNRQALDLSEKSAVDQLAFCLSRPDLLDASQVFKSVIAENYLEGEDLIIPGAHYDIELRCLAETGSRDDIIIDPASPKDAGSFWGAYKRPTVNHPDFQGDNRNRLRLADWLADYDDPLEAVKGALQKCAELNPLQTVPVDRSPPVI
ncbi:MAG: hypothetical protein IBX50_08600 [Marinospirillum sp.]|uniref:hypothetical protein n=1 Tax=Marinospirillum sp. TaxID=2183934 RepID=UPI0019E5751B|nr:hypothetical protein [Marinospirillum sp.]MBE0506766.1 hypothetical protein [Marinospirillum sp.]